MNEHKGSQYRKPDNEPDKQHGEEYNDIKETSGDDIARGAHQEDQLEKLQPDPETAEKQESQPPPHVEDGQDPE